MSNEARSIAVVIPSLNEEKYIEKCVRSVLNSDYPADKIEVWIADGESTDSTPQILHRLSEEDSRVKHLVNTHKTTPFALNLGLQASQADYLMILGAHSEIDSNYLSECASILDRIRDVGCVGGMLRNICLDETSSMISAAMSSPFGVGSAHFRTGAATGYVDTVAFGMYRREVFERIGYFDTDLTRNQDDEFNYRLLKHSGYRIYLTNAVFITYFVRASFEKLWRQYFQYGYWKVLVNKKHGSITTLRQLAPALWVSGLVAGLVLSLLSPWLAAAYVLTVVTYFTGAVVFASRLTEKNKPGIVRSFFILHHAYGLGYLKGILHFLLLNRRGAIQSASRTSR
ncbi:MAG: glycosyltransferase [Bacteroidota bacterium]